MMILCGISRRGSLIYKPLSSESSVFILTDHKAALLYLHYIILLFSFCYYLHAIILLPVIVEVVRIPVQFSVKSGFYFLNSLKNISILRKNSTEKETILS